MAEKNENNKENKGYGWVATGSLIGGSLPLITRKIKKGLTPDGDDKGRNKDKKKDKKKKSKKPRYILNKKSSTPKKLAKQKKRLKKKAKGKLPKKLKK